MSAPYDLCLYPIEINVKQFNCFVAGIQGLNVKKGKSYPHVTSGDQQKEKLS